MISELVSERSFPLISENDVLGFEALTSFDQSTYSETAAMVKNHLCEASICEASDNYEKITVYPLPSGFMLFLSEDALFYDLYLRNLCVWLESLSSKDSVFIYVDNSMFSFPMRYILQMVPLVNAFEQCKARKVVYLYTMASPLATFLAFLSDEIKVGVFGVATVCKPEAFFNKKLYDEYMSSKLQRFLAAGLVNDQEIGMISENPTKVALIYANDLLHRGNPKVTSA